LQITQFPTSLRTEPGPSENRWPPPAGEVEEPRDETDFYDKLSIEPMELAKPASWTPAFHFH